MLTYIEGVAGTDGFPEALRHERGLEQYGRFIRAFHDAVAPFDPGADGAYRVGPATLAEGEIVCHGDLGFWNTVWQGDRIMGIIDWDFAAPGRPVTDVALAAMPIVPFRSDEGAERFGLAGVDRRARLAALCSGYGGIEPADVVEAAVESLRSELELLHRLGGAGKEPWAANLAAGQARLFESVAGWLDEHGSSLS